MAAAAVVALNEYADGTAVTVQAWPWTDVETVAATVAACGSVAVAVVVVVVSEMHLLK